MLKIRKNCFETNSSSTHSIVICTQDEFNKLKNYKMFVQRWNEKILTFEEVCDKIRRVTASDQSTQSYLQDFKEAYLSNNTEMLESILFKLRSKFDFDVYVYSDFVPYDMEPFVEKYTTPGGEKIVTFGYYGYDG